MSRKYSLDRSALLKILLHALKYPTVPVSGFLLGEEKPSTAGEVSSSGASAPPRKILNIYDAIPVTHSFLTLSMPLDAALVQLQEHCKRSSPKIQIVGYYQCNERLDDSDLGDVGRKIASKIESLFPGCIALVVSTCFMFIYVYTHLTLSLTHTMQYNVRWMARPQKHYATAPLPPPLLHVNYYTEILREDGFMHPPPEAKRHSHVLPPVSRNSWHRLLIKDGTNSSMTLKITWNTLN